MKVGLEQDRIYYCTNSRTTEKFVFCFMTISNNFNQKTSQVYGQKVADQKWLVKPCVVVSNKGTMYIRVAVMFITTTFFHTK